jgi:hypothetical protein
MKETEKFRQWLWNNQKKINWEIHLQKDLNQDWTQL